MVTVRVSETYDLSTQVDKCGMIAVHTPRWPTVRTLWGGLAKNYKFARYEACDITLACASVLPADPTQIGTEAGDIAPQDMFNPILYKAVSNESFNTVLNRMYTLSPVNSDFGTTIGSIDKSDDMFNDYDDGNNVWDDWDYYYGLLADTDGWKKAMPQAGLEMRGLYPMVYQMLSNYGNMYSPQTTVGNINRVNKVTQDGAVLAGSDAAFFRGPAMKMPRFPLRYTINDDRLDIGSPDIPQTYVACIITPPAKLNKFYFRMRVTWYVTFEELCPLTEYFPIDGLGNVGSTHYGSDYVVQSRTMTNTTNLVDTKDADISLVNTSGK